MKTELLLRRIESDLEEALYRFFAVLEASSEATFFHPHPLTRAQASIIARYSGHDFFAAAVRDTDVIAYGMLRGWDEGYDVPSLGISVHPHFRRHHVGTTMMHFLHAIATLRGCNKIRLRVNSVNAPAIALYERLGYMFTPDVPGLLVGYFNIR